MPATLTHRPISSKYTFGSLPPIPRRYLTARGSGGVGGAPALSFVVRAKGGTPDSVNSAGITFVNTTVNAVQVLTFRSHTLGPVCQGRSLEGYNGATYGFGNAVGADTPGVAWPPPATVGASSSTTLPGWVSSAPDSDADNWCVERAGMCCLCSLARKR